MAQEPQNLANAIVIIGTAYLWSIGAMGWFPTLFFIAFALATWAHWHQTKDEKRLIELGIKQTEANIQNLNAATAIAIANTKLIANQMRQ